MYELFFNALTKGDGCMTKDDFSEILPHFINSNYRAWAMNKLYGDADYVWPNEEEVDEEEVDENNTN